MNRFRAAAKPLLICCIAICLFYGRTAVGEEQRLRLIVETDTGGDPDDEQSMVRFLLYANEWDVAGIIANRPHARDGENENVHRTGLAIVEAMIDAYGECWPRLREHDNRYPPPELLLERTVPGYNDTDEGVKLIIDAVDADNPRPVWYLNWGTDDGAAISCLKRALDQVLAERGPDGYRKFKERIYLCSTDKFEPHTSQTAPPFPIWIDPFRPEQNGKRWYHRFSELTRDADGFDLERDVRTGHGPLGALYPTNTTHRQKEGDTMTFLYLVPNGLGNPLEPTWGSWAGRHALKSDVGERNYYHATQVDTWKGTTHRDNTLLRWAADIQNDFRARLDWCVTARDAANHPPQVKVEGEPLRKGRAGDTVTFDAGGSIDPDGDPLRSEWILYGEPSEYSEPLEINGADSAQASVVLPVDAKGQTLHFVLIVRDTGNPPLARYARVRVQVE